MVVGKEFSGDTRLLLHGTGRRYFKSHVKNDDYCKVGIFMAPSFDLEGLHNVRTALMNAEDHYQDPPLLIVIDGDLPKCKEEGREESVIAGSIPLRNIRWAASCKRVKDVHFKESWPDLLDIDYKASATDVIAGRIIEYFKNLGFEEVKVK